MVEYTIKEYIQTKDGYEAKIIAIEKLIDAMLIETIDSVGDSGKMSYSMDDGQMKVTTQFRSISDISKGILGLEKVLHLYKNRRNGSLVVTRGRLNY